MELYEFYKKFTELVGTSDLQEIPKALEKHIETNNESFFKSLKTVHDDLTTDHLQPIFQYYLADRKEKTIWIHLFSLFIIIIAVIMKFAAIEYPAIILVLWYFYIWFFYGYLIIKRYLIKH